jgi:hypothetical protein
MRSGWLPVFLIIIYRLGSSGFLNLFRVDHIHTQIGEHRHDVFDLVGRHFIRRQDFVQLVVSDVAAPLRNLDKTLHGGIQKIKDGAVGRLWSRCLLIVYLCRRSGHYTLQKMPRDGGAWNRVPFSCGAPLANGGWHSILEWLP